MTRPPSVRRQNGERTRALILAAARKEFATRGFAGARIGAIARRAGVTKGLIFYHFQHKAGLFHALSEQRMAALAQAPPEEGPGNREDPFQHPLRIFAAQDETLDWVRFFVWEGLGAPPASGALPEEGRRRAGFQRFVATVRRHQQAGALPVELDSSQLALFLYMLGVYPYILPQFAHLITGAGPNDPHFRASFEQFVRDLEQVITGQSPPS